MAIEKYDAPESIETRDTVNLARRTVVGTITTSRHRSSFPPGILKDVANVKDVITPKLIETGLKQGKIVDFLIELEVVVQAGAAGEERAGLIASRRPCRS
ncbi:hypothetical protein WOLCODRAFT_148466 [Wolfiporia cocos MD-104 SS10]|uniref:Uncharacterized protein n=1 Tax=Wolfiporia cocos (strain MD-104) TaxID=742152 RepID=A0A2H3IWN7_WOLCO|nr:hypothetical protein WOLCODRAFT_148466 [Wolfiporia cocos MD-104 SS10]